MKQLTAVKACIDDPAWQLGTEQREQVAMLEGHLQDAFSQNKIDLEQRRLDHALSKLVPTSLTAKRAVAAHLMQIADRQPMLVIEQLQKMLEPSTAPSLLLQQYIDLLKAGNLVVECFAMFAMQSTANMPSGLSQHTEEAVAWLDTIVSKLVSSVDTSTDAKLTTVFPDGFFANAQASLNSFMTACALPRATQDKYKLGTVFANLQKVWASKTVGFDSLASSPDAVATLRADAATLRQAHLATRLGQAKEVACAVLSQARQLPVPPLSLVQSLRKLQAKLDAIRPEHVAELSVKQHEYELAKLHQELREYMASLHKGDALLSRVPWPELQGRESKIPMVAWQITDGSHCGQDAYCDQSLVEKVCQVSCMIKFCKSFSWIAQRSL